MPIQILMPALSPTMTEGKLVKWVKKEGDMVESGDVIAEIETDKATMEIEAADEGTLGKILVAEGTEGVPVNQVIGLLLEDGEDASALEGALEAPAPPPAAPPTSAPAPAPAPTPVAPAAPPPAPVPASLPVSPPLSSPGGGRIAASPLARRLAKERGLDLSQVTGTGPHGRIVKRDVEGAVPGMAPGVAPMPAQAPAPAPMAAPPPSRAALAASAQSHQDIPNSSVRKVVAQRLTESKQQVPHFYLSVDCTLDKLLSLRADLNAKSPEGDGAYKLSVNDFIIRGAALALLRVPAANAMWTGEAIRRYAQPDISVAVAIDDGLITPVVRNAAAKGVLDISNEMKALAARAREGKLQPEEYQGGTFTISNLGMYGIKEFAAIINPPQGAILAVGAGEERAVVRNGALAIATVMTCTLSVDHRVVDGTVGAELLTAFKSLIEDPVTILL